MNLSGVRSARRQPLAHCALVGWCFSFLAALPAFAEEEASRFAAVLAANPPREDVICSYTSTTTDSENPGEPRTVRYLADEASTADAPSGSMQLLAVNGEPPSAEALAEFEAEAKERPRQGERVVFDLPEEIQGSMRVAEEDASTVSFAFVPDIAGDDAEMAGKMQGRLVVDKPSLRVQRMTVTLDESFSPAPTVKISEFRQEMAFAVDPVTNATVLAEMAMTMRGRAFVFKKVDNEVRVTFSDFDCRKLPPAAGAVPEPEDDLEAALPATSEAPG